MILMMRLDQQRFKKKSFFCCLRLCDVRCGKQKYWHSLMECLPDNRQKLKKFLSGNLLYAIRFCFREQRGNQQLDEFDHFIVG